MNGPKICHKIDEFIDFELRQIDMSGIPIEIDELFGWSFKKKVTTMFVIKCTKGSNLLTILAYFCVSQKHLNLQI